MFYNLLVVFCSVIQTCRPGAEQLVHQCISVSPVDRGAPTWGKSCWCLGQNQSGRCGAPPAPPIDPSEFGSVTLIQGCLGDAKGLVPDHYNKVNIAVKQFT